MDIQVVTFDPVTGVASLGIPAVPKILTGRDKLTQIVVLSYLRNPGRDIFFPVEGSGLRKTIGQYNFSNPNEIQVLCLQRTKVVETEVISRQHPDQGSPEERLKKLVVLDIATDSTTGSTIMRVQIINEAGDVSDVLI